MRFYLIYFRCYNDGKYIKKLLWILAIYQKVIKKIVAATIFCGRSHESECVQNCTLFNGKVLDLLPVLDLVACPKICYQLRNCLY